MECASPNMEQHMVIRNVYQESYTFCINRHIANDFLLILLLCCNVGWSNCPLVTPSCLSLLSVSESVRLWIDCSFIKTGTQ
jgi:hypothetical protein